ncbi:MAG: conjugative transposon protein TraK [Candidatus Pedobacter colombiensis]|uniref:Conjugative transposon protein TraK n=1 Tax=Candidatus Pedobacter colombiensis TaxID=3121371 RepID=A0AAJ6B5V7_9SPHI|nr:conjugative transposon protein TraK [Pedobacter sp.]WEK17896.1 MAG: conjugative transposon protein TraK [Pedobacter sp.]
MFTKTKNIDTAFRQIRSFTIAVIAAYTLVCGYCIYNSYTIIKVMQAKVYVLANGKALEAYASERKDNIPIEAKDHISTFHQCFFTLAPDDKLIQATITKALYLADETAKRQYDNLKEQNYYSNIISGNVSQSITTDSIIVNTDVYPFAFRFFGRQEITRATTVTMRSLITEGFLRNVPRSENNSHGFLIEGWHTLENNDLSIKNR